MSAQRLRAAAAAMRARAEGVTSGAEWTGGHYWITDYDPSDPSGQTPMQRLIGGMDGGDAAHYSSWHPAAALAVADWLDMVAGNVENYGPNVESPWVRPHVQRALAVADAYLGEA